MHVWGSMVEYLEYLSDALGLALRRTSWDRARTLPLYLGTAADYELCSCDGTDFLVALPRGGQSLPELKRVVAQIARFTELPVALASDLIDSRQRRALVARGIPVVVPGRLAYLPFLGFAAQAEAKRRALGGTLTPRAQAALVTMMANPAISTSIGLREVTRMTASSASRAIDELAQHGLIERGKDGREVTFDYDRGRNALLKQAMPLLKSPVAATIWARHTDALAALPDAGETALADRSMLLAPAIGQKAVAKARLAELGVDEVLEGELSDGETVELQLWSYDPLVAGLGRVDDVSLALSLAGLGDERIDGELDDLFGEEGLWR